MNWLWVYCQSVAYTARNKSKNHFSERNGDIRMSPHEKEGGQEDANTKTETHSYPHPFIFVSV